MVLAFAPAAFSHTAADRHAVDVGAEAGDDVILRRETGIERLIERDGNRGDYPGESADNAENVTDRDGDNFIH